jgi:6-phosphogluconate dehydrogenase
MPHKGSELGRLGTAITWATNDAAILRTLHRRVVELVREFVVSGIREIANSARMSDRVAKTFGGSWRDVVASATQDGVPFPMPDDVLRYVKSFV